MDSQFQVLSDIYFGAEYLIRLIYLEDTEAATRGVP